MQIKVIILLNYVIILQEYEVAYQFMLKVNNKSLSDVCGIIVVGICLYINGYI